MLRRDFIVTLAGAAGAWPLVAQAQQAGRLRRIGVLMHSTPDEIEAQVRMAALVRGLQAAGWEVGRDLRLETRWSGGDLGRLRKNAEDLVGQKPDLILAGTGPTLNALLQVTRTVPIVFTQTIDPLAQA